MAYTRREFGTLALVSLPGAGLLAGMDADATRQLATAQIKPQSKVAGVQIGLNVPYDYGSRTLGGDQTLARTLSLGVNAVELRSQPVEMAMGSPGFANGAALPIAGSSPTDRLAVAEAVRRWRATVTMAAAERFREAWTQAGVAIEIVKFDDIYAMADDEVDFAFRLVKALGARALSTEIAAQDLSQTRRIGEFADRHAVMVGYHGHTETTPAHWETVFGYAAHNGANLDLGHFVAGMNTSPVPFLMTHHARITHVHVKDRRLGTRGGANVPFGEGDTPIVETLRLIRDNHWPIQATIEFEYPIPQGSDRMTEIRRCIDYCRAALDG